MIIDNKKRIYKIRVQEFLLAVITAIVASIAGVSVWFYPDFLGIPRSYYVITLVTLYVIYFLYHLYINITYIYFTDSGDKIILRYFSNRPFSPGKNSIEINKKLFAGYVVQKDFFGLKQDLILYQKMKNTKAKYPAVSISVLTGPEKEKLLNTLDRYQN